MFVGIGPMYGPYIIWTQAYKKALAPDTYTAFCTSLLPVSDNNAKLQACAAEDQISIKLGRPAITFIRTSWRYRTG